MLRSLLSSRLAFYISLIFLRLILDISYAIFIVPVFNYSGFELNIQFGQYALSWVVYISSLNFLNYKIKDITSYFFITAVTGVVAPLTSLFGLDSLRDIFPVVVTMLSLLIVFTISRVKQMPAIRVYYIHNSRGWIVILSYVLVAFLVFWYIFSGAANHLNFNLMSVYDFRESNAKITNIGILSYLNSWIYQVFSIFIMLFSLFKKRYTLFVFFVLIQFFYFGVNNHKSVLFYPLLILSIWYFFQNAKLSIVIPLSLSLVVLFTIFIFIFTDNIDPASLMVRRVFFIPAHITFSYFEYFAGNDFIYWSNSIFSSFIHYSYGDMSLARLIGGYQGTGAAANNGYISSGYAHGGFLGIFIYSLIIGYTLKIADMLSSEGIPLWFSLGLLAIPIRSLLISSDLLVVLLTHGFLVAIIILILFRQKRV